MGSDLPPAAAGCQGFKTSPGRRLHSGGGCGHCGWPCDRGFVRWVSQVLSSSLSPEARPAHPFSPTCHWMKAVSLTLFRYFDESPINVNFFTDRLHTVGMQLYLALHVVATTAIAAVFNGYLVHILVHLLHAYASSTYPMYVLPPLVYQHPSSRPASSASK